MTELTKKLMKVHDITSLINYWREELNWPLNLNDSEDLLFEYKPEEIGIAEKYAVKITTLKQLRPLIEHQPWGLFYIDFESKELPLIILKRILKAFIRSHKKNSEKIKTWNMEDLIFITLSGPHQNKNIHFIHFTETKESKLELKTFSWGKDDTQLHYLDNVLDLEKLKWPEDPNDIKKWREKWSSVFIRTYREVVTTSKQLVTEMAEITKQIQERVQEFFDYESKDGDLHQIYDTFRKSLIQDLKLIDFADIYAQTITYGLFSARITYEGDFIGDNLSQIIPNTNPFLKDIFAQFKFLGRKTSGLDFDDLGILELIKLLKECDIKAILEDFGRQKKVEDPVIHFYERFLNTYNPQQKVKRGVFYTPDPVVSFIVRSVNALLRNDFECPDGLADDSSALIHEVQDTKQNETSCIGQKVPKVQILDPATGTGTFLKNIIQQIWRHFSKKYGSLEKNEFKEKWNSYVSAHLLPRLFGFELMMAPYTIAFLRIELMLKETGYNFRSNKRIGIALTDALQPATSSMQSLDEYFGWLSKEASFANKIKNAQKISVIIGNPPYSRSSQNKGDFIERLMQTYKDPVRQEKNIQPLADDYIKFIRYAQYLIEKNGWGIVGMIVNHTFLKGSIHRGMREELMKVFDNIWILDLHGNKKIQEDIPPGCKDQNVFDIMQGVCIILLMKKPNPVPKNVYFQDLYGERNYKYDWLNEHDISSIQWNRLESFTRFESNVVNSDLIKEYEGYVPLPAILPFFNVGGKPGDDDLLISFSKDALCKNLNVFVETSKTPSFAIEDLTEAKRKILKYAQENKFTFSDIEPYNYRPFDVRWTYYNPQIWTRAVTTIKQHCHENLLLLSTKIVKDAQFNHIFISDLFTDVIFLSNTSSVNCFLFPVKLMNEPNENWNFSPLFLKYLDQMKLTVKKDDPVAALSYIYGILFSKTYRSRFNALLKNDFPRIPLTHDPALFQEISNFGTRLINLHLFKAEFSEPSHFPLKSTSGTSDLTLTTIRHENGQLYLNKKNYFERVSEDIFSFQIGKYRICQKWLHDRKGSVLSKDDVARFQLILRTLEETILLMNAIDTTISQHGGWPIL